MGQLVAAVDVGTGSARAGIFDGCGCLLGRAVAPIALHRPSPERAEQDSEDIWTAVTTAMRGAIQEAAARPEQVAGIGFDGTCSLVLRDCDGRPLAAAPDATDSWDTIVWLDHRARAEAAEFCEAAAALGDVSPEMQLPKLLWLKRHHPKGWRRLGRASDLADFLTWRASGSSARSICTLASKWGLRPHSEPSWPSAELASLGLGDIAIRCGLPLYGAPVGSAVGELSMAAATELGLAPGTPVAAGLIDAHAGAIGMLGRYSDDPQALVSRRALIAGTSTCIMGLLTRPIGLPGHWGPYPDVVLPGFWMLEGGQSASGALLDHLCRTWSRSEPLEQLRERVFRRIAEMTATNGPDLAPRLHVLPDFHGNRTPDAKADALGVVSGLSLDDSFDGFCRLFWRTCTGLALGLRQILDLQASSGYPADWLHLAGGHARSPHLVQLYADAMARPIAVSAASDPTLLGTAMAAAAAAALFPDLGAASRSMNQLPIWIEPDPASRIRMARDYAAFLALGRQRAEIENILRTLSAPEPHRPDDGHIAEHSAGEAVKASTPHGPVGAPAAMANVR